MLLPIWEKTPGFHLSYGKTLQQNYHRNKRNKFI